MKKLINKLSLLLALILVINSCSTFCIFEAKAEDTSVLTIEGVNLDISNAADVNENRILTSKELNVAINTSSSSGDTQTFTLYKINGDDKEQISTIDITPYYSENMFRAQASFSIDTPYNEYSSSEYCVGVKSYSHPTEVFEDVKTSSGGQDVKLIEIDKINPVKEKGEVNVKTQWYILWEKAHTTVTATFKDTNSGIKKIEYKVDNGEKQEYALNETNSHAPGKSENVLIELDGKNHIIDFIITDNAGNEFQCSSSDFNTEFGDNVGPRIDSVTFEPYVAPPTGSTTETTTTAELKTFAEISKILYSKICIVNEPFTIKVSATDIAQDGAAVAGMSDEDDAVALYDGDEFITNMTLKNGYYVYTVNSSISADVLTIHAKDKNGYETIKKISEIDNSKKDSYYMEIIKPFSKPDYKNAINNNGQYWFNNNGGDFIIEVEDKDSGIKSITITDTVDSVVNENLARTFDNQEKKYTHIIDTSLLESGIHTFSVTVVDNCGNTCNNYYVINVDHDVPSISYEVKAPNKTVIDNQDWYDINDELEIVATVTKSISDIEEVSFKVNNHDYIYNENIDEINKNKTINLKISVKDYLDNNENEMVITGFVKSESGNDNNSQDIYECHIDKNDPEINSITINKIVNMPFQSTLNLIKSGIYSNGAVNIEVEASDAEGDSGISHVEFVYYNDGLKIVHELQKNGNQFEYALPFSTDSDTFNCEFEIIAYDKYGKNSKYSPTIQDGEGNSTDNYFIMQEKIEPEIEINLPKSDGRERTDNQVWYNKNKSISINLKDMQSGIRYAKIYVNGVEIKEDVNRNSIIDTEISKNLNKNKTALTYSFTTDYIIEKVGEAEDGNYKIKVEISDNAGNISVDNKKEFNIDKTKPNVDKLTFSRKSADGIIATDEFVTDLKYGYYFNDTFYLKVDTSDEKPSSGLDRIEYKLVSYNNGKKESTNEKTSTILNGVAKIDVPKDFKGQIFITAFDMVGNVSKEVTTLGYVEDENAPEIEISELKETEHKDNNGNNLYSKSVAVNVLIKDKKSGIKTLEYYVDAENNKVEKKIVSLENEGYKEGDKLENGWIITKMDKNLVVEVKREFVFAADDNDVVAYFKASDRAGNKTKYNKTQKFSIDKTKPIIKVDFANGVASNTKYYNGTKKALMTITVEERNFDEKLIDFIVEDSYKKNNITSKFVKEKDNYTYVATIDYPEGDYSVHLSGKDIVGHEATVFANNQKNGQESFTTDFIVDTTNPSVSTNFASFTNSESKNDNYFSKKKTATIIVREHNFDSELMNLNVWEKEPGQGQNLNGTEKYSYAAYSGKGWDDNGDVHSIELQFERDGIYKIEIKPSDLSENEGETDSTAVFEIDTTAPEVIMINGDSVDKNKTNTVEVYDEESKDDTIPTVEYFDTNFDHIEYEMVEYVPEYSREKEFSKVEPLSVKKSINKKEFKLDNFEKDGIYAVEMVAYDKAGNVSKVNKNTYVRMMNTDVLAYIEDSCPGTEGKTGTGWYSIEDEDGPLSKRPDNFEDLNIAVLTKNDSKTSITLNSNDGEIIDTGVECSAKEEVYGAGVYRYVLSKDYFKDHYQEDTDATFYLTVNNNDDRIELGQIHIDNIAPECKLPSYFHNWGWIKGTGDKAVKITNISEKIDINSSFVYIDGEKVDYSYDSSKNSLEFPIKDGSHSVGISLVDYAGNAYDVPEISHLGVGNFRLYLGVGTAVLLLAGCFGSIIFRRKRKVRNLE